MRLREATTADATALLELERAANLVALGHVFPPGEHPYPSADVLARWQAVLADDEVVTLVLEDAAPRPHLLALVAFDAGRIRHLAVHPDHWGRGLARRAVGEAVARMSEPVVRLWVLSDNHRAREFYEHLGWWRTGREQPAEFPPYPREIELAVNR